MRGLWLLFTLVAAIIAVAFVKGDTPLPKKPLLTKLLSSKKPTNPSSSNLKAQPLLSPKSKKKPENGPLEKTQNPIPKTDNAIKPKGNTEHAPKSKQQKPKKKLLSKLKNLKRKLKEGVLSKLKKPKDKIKRKKEALLSKIKKSKEKLKRKLKHTSTSKAPKHLKSDQSKTPKPKTQPKIVPSKKPTIPSKKPTIPPKNPKPTKPKSPKPKQKPDNGISILSLSPNEKRDDARLSRSK